MLLDGKTALVTGAANGIGLGIAQRLAEEGASVAIADRDEAHGAAAANSIERAGGKAFFIRADLSDLDDIDRMIEAAAARLGRIDILVNNAGVTKRIAALDITPEEWDWVQGINTRGLFFCLQGVARRMKDSGGGQIVNIASIAGKGQRGASNISYAASKAAAITIARVAASELGQYGIRVNSVCPGPTRTDMWNGLEAASPDIAAGIVAAAALGRVSEAGDIADAVVFLASDLSRNVTGQSLNVDGGTMWD